jgi:hypothetical protein
MSSRSRRRFWVAFASVVLLVFNTLAGAVASRPFCTTAAADTAYASDPCCVKNDATDSHAEAGMTMCSLQCSAASCAAIVIAPSIGFEPALAVPVSAPPTAYAGWLPAPASPPPRSLLLV